MNQEIKLTCPWCREEFKTKRRDKVWCDPSCSRSYSTMKQEIEKQRKSNEITQKFVKIGHTIYDPETEKYYNKAIYDYNKSKNK